MIRWVPPPDGYMKINSDGAIKVGMGLATSGGAMEDIMSNWIWGYARNIGYCNVYDTELWGAFDGLDKASKDRCWSGYLELGNLAVDNQ